MREEKRQANDQIRKDIGKRLRLAREALGLRQVDLALATDIPRSKLNQYETGLYFPQLWWLKRLRKQFRIDTNFLVLDELDGLPPQIQRRIREPRDQGGPRNRRGDAPDADVADA